MSHSIIQYLLEELLYDRGILIFSFSPHNPIGSLLFGCTAAMLGWLVRDFYIHRWSHPKQLQDTCLVLALYLVHSGCYLLSKGDEWVLDLWVTQGVLGVNLESDSSIKRPGHLTD